MIHVIRAEWVRNKALFTAQETLLPQGLSQVGVLMVLWTIELMYHKYEVPLDATWTCRQLPPWRAPRETQP